MQPLRRLRVGRRILAGSCAPNNKSGIFTPSSLHLFQKPCVPYVTDGAPGWRCTAWAPPACSTAAAGRWRSRGSRSTSSSRCSASRRSCAATGPACRMHLSRRLDITGYMQRPSFSPHRHRGACSSSGLWVLSGRDAGCCKRVSSICSPVSGSAGMPPPLPSTQHMLSVLATVCSIIRHSVAMTADSGRLEAHQCCRAETRLRPGSSTRSFRPSSGCSSTQQHCSFGEVSRTYFMTQKHG